MSNDLSFTHEATRFRIFRKALPKVSARHGRWVHTPNRHVRTGVARVGVWCPAKTRLARWVVGESRYASYTNLPLHRLWLLGVVRNRSRQLGMTRPAAPARVRRHADGLYDASRRCAGSFRPDAHVGKSSIQGVHIRRITVRSVSDRFLRWCGKGLSRKALAVGARLCAGRVRRRGRHDEGNLIVPLVPGWCREIEPWRSVCQF